MPSPSRSEGENFTMNPDAMAAPQRKEPLSADDRFWLWFWGILLCGAVALAVVIAASVIFYYRTITPEQICASRFDPPEFCRELAKRNPAHK